MGSSKTTLLSALTALGLFACSGTSVGTGAPEGTSGPAASSTAPSPSTPSGSPSSGASSDSNSAGPPTGSGNPTGTETNLGNSRFSITVDGEKGTPLAVNVSTDVIEGVPRHSVSLMFSAQRLGSMSRVIISASQVGSGCTASPGNTGMNEVEYQPDNGSYGDFWSAPWSGPCGLTITDLDPNHMTGSFSGTVTSTDASNVKTTAVISVSFDILP